MRTSLKFIRKKLQESERKTTFAMCFLVISPGDVHEKLPKKPATNISQTPKSEISADLKIFWRFFCKPIRFKCLLFIDKKETQKKIIKLNSPASPRMNIAKAIKKEFLC